MAGCVQILFEICVFQVKRPLETICFLSQVAYQVGNYELAKKVFSPVWDYIVASPLQDDQSVITLSNIMTVTQRR